MMTPEETKVLEFLRSHRSPSLAEVAKACQLGKADPEWVDRVVANLNWLGYVAVHHGADGEVAMLQITEKGMQHVGGKKKPKKDVRR